MKKFVLFAAVALTTLGLWIPAAQAAPFTGQFGPTVIGGSLDLNGDGNINSGDTWVEFYGNTDVIAGGLDCDNWGATPNDGSSGSGSVNFLDDCILIGYDGTADGVTYTVSNGSFVEKDGVAIPDKTKLATVFNATSPANPSVVAADFAWQAIGGSIDVNQNGLISAADCTFNIVNGWDILSSLCASVPDSDNGKVDVSRNGTIGTDDDSASGFFGLAVEDGVVQAGASPVTVTSFTPTSGAVGTVVTITGTGFAAGATVAFNGTLSTTVTDITATTLKATVPTGATDGPIKVTVGANSGTSTASFDVTALGTPPPGCTILGTGAADTLVGTPDSDTLCGKGGPDLLKGKGGDDLLKGGAGQDTLKGGPGFDTCKGGKGRDILKGCEAE